MPRREDDIGPRASGPSTRSLLQAGGFLLAAAATLAVLLTDNAQLLKVAVVAVAWAFVLATFAAGRRGTDRLAAAVRERELRRNYELELEREVAARHEYELELENELRGETQDAMRDELDALRGDIAALSGLREEVARVSALRNDIVALTSLRDEVARVAALRDDVKALDSLRQDLGQLAELRADIGRLRAELTEQFSSELLVERIIMRTQASRLPGEGQRLEQAVSWTDDVPPRELTGGWPAVRLDEPRGTQQFEQVRVDRPLPRPPVPAVDARSWDAPVASTPPPAPQPDRWSALTDPAFAEPPQAPAGSRHSAGEPAPQTAGFPLAPPTGARPVPYRREATPAELPPSPLEWLTARSVLDPPAARPEVPMTLRPEVPPPATLRPEVPPLRRRTDEEPAQPQPTAQRSVRPAGRPPVRVDDRGGYRVAVRDDEPPPSRSEPTTQGTRVAEILAENGVTPPSGGRRRRRYRDDGETDDVLARVLGRN